MRVLHAIEKVRGKGEEIKMRVGWLAIIVGRNTGAVWQGEPAEQELGNLTKEMHTECGICHPWYRCFTVATRSPLRSFMRVISANTAIKCDKISFVFYL